jgi:seryl-tRNA synthetase
MAPTPETRFLTRFLSSSANIDAWGGNFTAPTPEFDWQYLCDDANLAEIEQNIADRKGVGDIAKVVSLCQNMQLLIPNF